WRATRCRAGPRRTAAWRCACATAARAQRSSSTPRRERAVAARRRAVRALRARERPAQQARQRVLALPRRRHRPASAALSAAAGAGVPWSRRGRAGADRRTRLAQTSRSRLLLPRPAIRQRPLDRDEEALEEAVGEPPDDVAPGLAHEDPGKVERVGLVGHLS